MICIWSSWCHCHRIMSCFIEIQYGLPFWCRLTQVVLEKRLLNWWSVVVVGVIVAAAAAAECHQCFDAVGLVADGHQVHYKTTIWTTRLEFLSVLLLLLQPFYGSLDFVRATWVSRYQRGKTIKVKTNLDLLEQESEWQWHHLGHMQICTSPQTDHHASIPPLLSVLQC